MGEISQVTNENISFSMLEDLLHFLLTDLCSKSMKELFLIPEAMLHISINFNYDNLEKHLNIDYLLETCTNIESSLFSQTLTTKLSESELPKGITPGIQFFKVTSNPSYTPHRTNRLDC